MFQKSSPMMDTNIVQPSVAPAVSHDDAVETVVGPSVVVEGDFSSEGNIIVKGTVSGSVNTSKLLRVEEGAKIFANVKTGSAVIAGSIKGNAKVADRLELLSAGRIMGDVECKVLVVEAGAIINGKVSMGGFDGEDGRPEKKTNFGRIKTRIVDKDSGMSDPV